MSDVALLVDRLRRRGETVGCAESLTGGLVCATLVAVPGASDVVRGGIVAYASDLKADLLGVDERLLVRHGAVAVWTAEAMARGTVERLRCTYGLATTGVAGPDPSEHLPPGTVFVAVVGPAGVSSRALQLAGDRQEVRERSVAAVLDLLADQL